MSRFERSRRLSYFVLVGLSDKVKKKRKAKIFKSFAKSIALILGGIASVIFAAAELLKQL